MNLVLVKFKNERDALHAVSHKLWQIVVEMLIHHDQVVFEVLRDIIQVEENLLEVLLNKRQQPDEFYIAEA